MFVVVVVFFVVVFVLFIRCCFEAFIGQSSLVVVLVLRNAHLVKYSRTSEL